MVGERHTPFRLPGQRIERLDMADRIARLILFRLSAFFIWQTSIFSETPESLARADTQ
jgi:hypothetical protein